MFERYSFVALTTSDLSAARRFWVEQLGFPVTEERPAEFFIVDAGGLRLCVDLADGEVHLPGSTDPVIGLKVASVRTVLDSLAQRGLSEALHCRVESTYAVVHDPDGRAVILTQND